MCNTYIVKYMSNKHFNRVLLSDRHCPDETNFWSTPIWQFVELKYMLKYNSKTYLKNGCQTDTCTTSHRQDVTHIDSNLDSTHNWQNVKHNIFVFNTHSIVEQGNFSHHCRRCSGCSFLYLNHTLTR